MKVKVEGLRECQEALAELPKATSRNVLKRALLKSGQPMAEMAEQKAPKLTGHLQKSIAVSSTLSKKEQKNHRSMIGSLLQMTVAGWRSAPKKAVYVFVGAGPIVQASKQEFGTAHHGPQPYMRPAFDSQRMKVVETIKDLIWAEIDKARTRLAKKAARLAAK